MTARDEEDRPCDDIAGNQSMEPCLAALVDLCARLAGSSLAEAERLAVRLLALPRKCSWRSSLNNDGSPLQLGISIVQSGCRPAVRLIADPASDVVDGCQRWDRAVKVLSEVLASHAPDLKELCYSTIERNLPIEPAALASLPHGAIWLAADLSGEGMALYATAKWGHPSDRWARTCQWVEETLPTLLIAHKVLNRLSSRSEPVSVGVEGTSTGNARVKVYWRLGGAAALDDLGLGLFDSAAMCEFLYQVINNRRIPRAGIVGSIGFRLADGSISDVKLDVCGHCVRRTSADWMQVIQRCTEKHELPRLTVQYPTLLATAEVAFIGLGLNAEQTPRLNIYLKSPRL